MSLLDVWVRDDRAFVVVDTCANARNAEGKLANLEGHYAKILVLPHANAVFAGRGSFTFLHSVFLEIATKACDGIDEIVAAIPAAFASSQSRIAAMAAALQANDELLWAQEIVVVGWSAKHGRMRGQLAYSDGREEIETRETAVGRDAHRGPGPPAWAAQGRVFVCCGMNRIELEGQGEIVGHSPVPVSWSASQ